MLAYPVRNEPAIDEQVRVWDELIAGEVAHSDDEVRKQRSFDGDLLLRREQAKERRGRQSY